MTKMGRSYDKIGLVTIQEILEQERRLQIPMSLEVLAAAQRASTSAQLDWL